MRKISIIERVLDAEKRHMHVVQQQVKKIMALSDTMAALTDQQLQAKTWEFKERWGSGESLESLLPEAYAVVREAARRVLGLYPYEVQLIGAVILHYGDIAEMKTGEGKTLTSTMPIYLNALTGQGVHVVTTNDYLAHRDAEEMGQVFSFLGLTVGYNHRALSSEMKRAEFAKDITYTTNAELGFDYLRDGMAKHKSQRVLRGLSFALIDEVDSILIDEARTPLIISGSQKDDTDMFIMADRYAKSLRKDDYEYDAKDKVVFLTEAGIRKAEQFFGITNLYHPDHMTTVHFINQALKANYVMKRDIDYVVDEDEILIVDEFTGRAMKGRNYSNGLHQAIEAKEGVTVKRENMTLATITYQNFFRLYHKLAGMSGTAKTNEQEFIETYNMRVLEVETNLPVIRIEEPDEIFATKREKFEACVRDVVARHKKGQPVLIGTAFIADSEYMSSLLDREHIPHEVLNAKQHAKEAAIVSQAGQRGAVTIATNMAGRGTDIKLGEGVAELGGLAILGLQRHDSKRIDNQLRGRAGRQGDPGYAKFYVSLEDDLIVRYASPEKKKQFSELLKNNIDKLRKEIDSLQMTVENDHYHTRKSLLEYDDVMRQQRTVITQQRDMIMEVKDPMEIIANMAEEAVRGAIDRNHLEFRKATDYDRVSELLNQYHGPVFEPQKLMNLSRNEIIKKATSMFVSYYSGKTREVRDEIADFERYMILKHLDDAWVSHVDDMLALKDGIYLRSYAQKKPSEAYSEEGYERFEEMLQTVASNVLQNCMMLEVAPSSI